MGNKEKTKKQNLLFEIICLGASLCVLLGLVMSVIGGDNDHKKASSPKSFVNYDSVLPSIPAPGEMISTSQEFVPAVLKGIKIFPNNPLRFDFIVDTGNMQFQEETLQTESAKLIKYFLASLTVPEDDLWVNLSPYESERIIPGELGKTDLGRDMLAQDYLLKQLTASLMYPKDKLGSKFWKRVYKKAKEKFGTTEIPINTFNKVWVVPENATVYENGNIAYVVESRLKVMLEEDYLALKNNKLNKEVEQNQIDDKQANDISSQIIREIILPEIEKEVNYGKNFTTLRQLYHSLILAKWYEETIKETILNQVYVDQNKIAGIDLEDKNIKNKIYDQYVEAYKKGVFDFINEDYDESTRKVIPRRYFSGGETFANIPLNKTKDVSRISSSPIGDNFQLSMRINPQNKNGSDKAMMGEFEGSSSAIKSKEILSDALKKQGLSRRNITQRNIDDVQRLISNGMDFEIVPDPNGDGVDIKQSGFIPTLSSPVTLLDFLRDSAFFNNKVFPNVKAVALDMDGTIIGGTPESDSEAIEALVQLLDVVDRVYIISSNEFKNVEKKIIQNLPINKRHKISVFSGRGTILTEFDKDGSVLEKTATLGEKHLRDNFLTETNLQKIESAVNEVVLEYDQYVKNGGPQNDRTWRERYPGFYEGYYINSTGKHEEYKDKARINKTDKNGSIVSIRRIIQFKENLFVDMVITQLPSKKYALNGIDDERPEFIRRIKEKLSDDILDLIDIVPESSVGIGIKRKGVGKSIAMQEIFKSFKADEVVYIGDEFWEGGMDYEIADQFPVITIAVDEEQTAIHPKAWGTIGNVVNTKATSQWLRALLENKLRVNLNMDSRNYYLAPFIDSDLMSAFMRIVPLVKLYVENYFKLNGRYPTINEVGDFVQNDEEVLKLSNNRKIEQIPDLIIISGVDIDTSKEDRVATAKELFNQMMTTPLEEVDDAIRKLRDSRYRRSAIIALKWLANVTELRGVEFKGKRIRAKFALKRFSEMFFSEFGGKEMLDVFSEMVIGRIQEGMKKGLKAEEMVVVPLLTSGEQIGQYLDIKLRGTKVALKPLLFTTAMSIAFGRTTHEKIFRANMFTEEGKEHALRYLRQEGILADKIKHIIFVDTGMSGSFGKLFNLALQDMDVSEELLLIDHADYERAGIEKEWAYGLNEEMAWIEREKELRWMCIMLDHVFEHSEESPSHNITGIPEGIISAERRPTHHPWFASFSKNMFEEMAKEKGQDSKNQTVLRDGAMISGETYTRITKVLSLFGADDVDNIQELQGNILHQDPPVLIETTKGKKLVLRKTKQNMTELIFIVSLMRRLKEKGIPAPLLYSKDQSKSFNSKDYIVEHEGALYLLEQYLDEGGHVPLENINNNHLRSIARLAGEINNAVAGFKPEGEKVYKSRTDIAEQIGNFFVTQREQLIRILGEEDYEFLTQQLETFYQFYKSDAQIISVIHGDMNSLNVKFNQYGIITALMDFDFSIIDHRIVEFNNMVMGQNADDKPYNREKLLAIISAYNRAVDVKLSDEEIVGIIQIIRLRFLEDLKSRILEDDLLSDSELLNKFIAKIRAFDEDFSNPRLIAQFIRDVRFHSQIKRAENGMIKDPKLIDWLMMRVEAVHDIPIKPKVKSRVLELLRENYANELAVKIDKYADGLDENEKRQLYLIAREAGIFHNGTFDKEGFPIDIEIDELASQRMKAARERFQNELGFLKSLSKDYWENNLPKYKGDVTVFNADKLTKKPKVSIAIVSIFGRRHESLLKRLEELNRIQDKGDIELVITIADPENITFDEWKELEEKIQTVGYKVSVILTKKNTISTNRNLAASISNGGYQIFIDDDVSLNGPVIEKMVQALEKYPELGIVSIPAYNRKLELYKPRFQMKSFIAENVLVANLVLGMVTCTRRDIIDVNPFFSLLGNMGDDIHYVRQMHMLGFLGGYVLDNDIYAIDEELGESATKGQISLSPYLIEEGLAYFLNRDNYSEFEHRRAGFKIHAFSKWKIDVGESMRFWRYFSEGLVKFLNSDEGSFDLDWSLFEFEDEIRQHIQRAVEFYIENKAKILSYKKNEYDPKNLSGVNTFFGELRYSRSISEGEVSFVNPLEGGNTQNQRYQILKEIGSVLIELSQLQEETKLLYEKQVTAGINQKTFIDRGERLFAAYKILMKLRDLKEKVGNDPKLIFLLEKAILNAKRASKESFLYLIKEHDLLAVVPFDQMNRFGENDLKQRHHHIGLHPMAYITDGISISEVQNPARHDQKNHYHDAQEMTIALSGCINVIEVNKDGERTIEVPPGSIIQVPVNKMHRIANPNNYPTADFTIKNPFISLRKGVDIHGVDSEGSVVVVPPRKVEQMSGDRGRILTHFYPNMPDNLLIDGENQLVVDGSSDPIVKNKSNVKVRLVYLNPGKESDNFEINPVYDRFLPVRIFPWTEELNPNWNMEEDSKKIFGEVELFDEDGISLLQSNFLGGDLVVIRGSTKDDGIVSGFKIRNTSKDKILVFAIIERMSDAEIKQNLHPEEDVLGKKREVPSQSLDDGLIMYPLEGESGRETKERYVREIERLRQEKKIIAEEDQLAEMKSISSDELRGSLEDKNARKEYLKAINEVLDEKGESVVNPLILKEAARRALRRINGISRIKGKLGLQGGTFNPLTYGHITAALAGIISEGLNGVIIANGGTVPDKPFAASARLRNEMAELAVRTDPSLQDKLFVSTIREYVVRMFLEENAINIAGKDDKERKFNMDMAAFIWLFNAHPDVEWTYMVGSDKVNDYGWKQEKALMQTFKDNNATVLYFERKGAEIDVTNNIKKYPWLYKLWTQGFFNKAKVRSASTLAASKVRRALAASEDNVEGMKLSEAIPQVILDFIKDPEQETLRVLYDLDVKNQEIEVLLKKSKYGDAIRKYKESLDILKKLQNFGVRDSEVDLVNNLEHRIEFNIKHLYDLARDNKRKGKVMISFNSATHDMLRLAVVYFQEAFDIFKESEDVENAKESLNLLADTMDRLIIAKGGVNVHFLVNNREELKAALLDKVKDGKFKLKGENVDVLTLASETGQKAGPMDRKIVEALGYVHQTANIVLIAPNGKILLQLRNKDNFDDYLAMAGGHLDSGQEHIEGALKEAREETGVNFQKDDLEYLGMESYDVDFDTNKEVRSWYAVKLTEGQYLKIKKRLEEELDEVKVSRENNSRDDVKAGLQKLWGKGRGEVLGYYEFGLNAITTAGKKKDPSKGPYQGKEVRFLKIEEEYAGKKTDVEALFTPDSLDHFVENQEILEKLKNYIDSEMLSDVGGIDMNDIKVERRGSGVNIQFDPVMIQNMLDQGVDGFVPIIINLTPINSIMPLLGLEPRDREEEYELSVSN